MPPSGGATNDENYSPPSEGCRGAASLDGTIGLYRRL